MNTLYNEDDVKIIIGHLNMSLPFLAKTIKGNLYTPSFYIDDKCNFLNAIPNSDNNFVLFEDGEEKIAIDASDNIDKKKAKYYSLSIAEKDTGKWYSLRGWGNIAKNIHLNFKKGDLVHVKALQSKDHNNKIIWDIIEIILIRR